MKILVIAAAYPDLHGGFALSYVHVRNRYYLEHGFDVTVLSFRAQERYTIDGIRVLTPETYASEYADAKFDLLVSHAPNVREHYRFLRKYEQRFPHIVFFHHGHEICKLNQTYPAPFPYVKGSGKAKKVMQAGYDCFKLKLWQMYYPKIAHKAHWVFVSQYLFGLFKKYVKITDPAVYARCHIIHNGVGTPFEQQSWRYDEAKTYDFVSVRSGWDGSTYCVDLITALARQNPHHQFLLTGKGEFFSHFSKPDNLITKNQMFSHQELLKVLDSARCGLMLTRHDAQGVMTCEMLTYGMPVITSDIPVCQEIVRGFPNARCVPNGDTPPLGALLEELERGIPYTKNPRYFAANTAGKECDLFEQIVKEGQI